MIFEEIGGCIKEILLTMLMSALPVIELRGGIPFGVAQGLTPQMAFVASIIGNMLPIPFVILFIRQIFEWMRKVGFLSKFVDKMEKSALEKSDKVRRYEWWGLCFFVAIPLPGTGAWTGALIASVLNMRMRRALPSIFLGVIIAGIVVTGLTFGFISLI